MKGVLRVSGLPGIIDADVTPSENVVTLNGRSYSANQMKWDPPVNGTVYGTLLNYRGALAAMGDLLNEAPYRTPPKAPVLYIKSCNTVIGCGIPIPMPTEVTELEMGASLGVVIGRTASRVSEAQVFQYIAGYTVANDVSVPHSSVYRPAVQQRCRDGFCPIGPWVIEQSAVPNPDALGIRVWINGELRQENTTANLVRSVSRLIAEVTDFMTLYSGDTLLVGVPEGAPVARAGDCVRIEIDGVGSLQNRVVPEREWVAGGYLS